MQVETWGVKRRSRQIATTKLWTTYVFTRNSSQISKKSSMQIMIFSILSVCVFIINNYVNISLL